MKTIINLLVTAVYWIELTAFTLFLFALSFVPRSMIGPIYERLFHSWSRLFVKAMRVDLRVHQKYAGALPDQYIVIANHPSAFEDIGMPAVFKAYSVAKIEVKKWFLVGRISAAAGTIYLRREDKNSRAAASETIKEHLRAGENIAIYPEGGCKGRRINQFLYGIFEISIETGVPIVPLFIHYEAQEDFEWQGQTLIQKMWQIVTAANHTANFYIHDPFEPKDFDAREDYCDHVHQQYLIWQDKYLL